MQYLYDTILQRAWKKINGDPNIHTSQYESIWLDTAKELLQELINERLYITALELEKIIEANS